MDSNQASEQDHPSIAKILQADQIDDHRVIATYIYMRNNVRQSHDFAIQESQREKSLELVKYKIAKRSQSLIKKKIWDVLSSGDRWQLIE
jgi:hypothetical protein